MKGRALALCGCALLAGCGRPDDSAWSRFAHDPSRLDSLLRRRLGKPPADIDARAALEPLVRSLRAAPPRDTSFAERVRAIAASLAGPGGITAVTDPDDTDLVPTLAFERRRGGCTSLAQAWSILGEQVGLRLVPVLLPGHMTLRDPSSGRFVDPLRGRERTVAFYDSVFGIRRRPGYAGCPLREQGLEAAMALQGGLLAWKAGREREALDAFRVAARLAPGLPEAEGNLGLVFEALGERDSARVHLAVAVAGDPLNVEATRRLEALR